MLPFEKAIKEGVDAVMLGHLVIRKITNGLPVSISSRFIKKYLREKNKFGGLVITDEINMLSRNIFYRFIYMKRAFLSGSDMILLKLKDNGCSIFDKLNKLITKNVEYQMLVNDSVERIIKIKNKYRISDEYFDGCNIDLINKDIENLNNLCSND